MTGRGGEDLVVIGWTAALVYDTPEGALPVMQLLEFANSQLLELRTYDALLDRELDAIYKLQPGGASRTEPGRRDAEEQAPTLRYLIVDDLELHPAEEEQPKLPVVPAPDMVKH